MPLYDLKCKQCEHVFELLCASRDWETGKIPCPACKGTGLERAYTRPAGVVMKTKAAATNACPSSGVACPRAGRCGGH